MPNTLKYRINSKKSLCKSKKEKKCKKIKGCKMARGPKKTFCRKIKNKKYGKTKKKRGGRMSLSELTKSPMAQQFSKELPSVNSLKDGAKTLLIGPAKEKLEKMLKEKNINLEEEDLNEIIDEISKLEVNEMKPLLEALINAFNRGDEMEIIQTLMKNKKVRGIGLKIMKKNPVLMKQIMESMRGGNYTEAKKALTDNAFASYKGKTNNLDRILQSHPTNTRSISDMVEETKEHERNAERYRDKYRNLTANSSYIEKQNNTFEEAMKRRNERLNSKGSETLVPFS